METWNELTVKVKTEDTARASDVCTVIADMGIYVEDYSDLENVVWNIAHVDLIETRMAESVAGNDLAALLHLLDDGIEAVVCAQQLADVEDQAVHGGLVSLQTVLGDELIVSHILVSGQVAEQVKLGHEQTVILSCQHLVQVLGLADDTCAGVVGLTVAGEDQGGHVGVQEGIDLCLIHSHVELHAQGGLHVLSGVRQLQLDLVLDGIENTVDKLDSGRIIELFIQHDRLVECDLG